MIERDIEKLWGNYEKFLNMTGIEGISKLLEDHGQRIAEASYSLRKSEPFCGIGGVLEYSIELMKNTKKLNEALGYCQTPKDIIAAALLSPIGYIGTLQVDRFIITKSEWHKEKLGQFYDWNESCPKYSIQDMSLWYLQHYGIKLDWKIWQAILLNKSFQSEESRFYDNHKERLSILLNSAREITLKNEFDRLKGIYTVPF